MPKEAVNKATPKAKRGFQKGDPRINRTKPGPGRPPDAFKAMCRGLASSKEVEKTVREILKTKNSPLFVGALKWASEHGYGKPEQPITGAGGGPLDIRVTFDKGGPPA